MNDFFKMQVVVLALMVLFSFLWQGISVAMACFYGGSISVANSSLQRWSLIGLAKDARSNVEMNLRAAYRCVAERWTVTIVIFVVGFVVLKFLPLPLMIGFIVTQLTLLFETYRTELN